MKILVLNHNQKGIGTYRRSFYFSRELSRHGHDVTMITVSRSQRFRPRTCYKTGWLGEATAVEGDGPRVRMIEAPALGYRWLPGWGSGPLDIGLRIAEVTRGGYDALYGFEYHPNVSWPVYATKWWRAYRFYSDWCDWYAGIGNRFRDIELAHRVDAFFEERIRLIARKVTTNSSVLRDRAIGLGIPAERVVFIAEGADPEYIQPVDSQPARARLGLTGDGPILGTVIDLYWRETLSVFSDVARQLPEVRLLVVGRRDRGLEEAVTRRGLQDRVVLTGWVPDEAYPLWLGCADVLVLVMKKDRYDLGRWPGKIGDYFAAGRATVITDVGDAAAFAKAHRAAVVVPTIEDLPAAIVTLLETPSERAAYGQAARAAAEGPLSWRALGGLMNDVVAS